MIRKNRRHMIKASAFQTISGIGIISFLLFFLNLLALVSYQVALTGDQVQEKLGMYFYLNESTNTKDETYAQTIDMMQEMKKAGLDVSFYSKDDAFSLLKKRLPDVIGSLEKYNIDNPLPPTLYVLFDNQDEYEVMKTILLNYEDSVINMDDTQWMTFGEQEQRVAKVVNLMNFLQLVSYFLIAVTVLIVIAFLGYAIRLNFFRFHKQIEVEKLLGAPYMKIMAPFLLYSLLLLVVAFFVASGYMRRLMEYVHGYFLEAFSISLYDQLPHIRFLGAFFVIQFVALIVLNLVFASSFLWRLLRRI